VPRIVDHDAQRAELLDKAFPLFADRGYGGVTMRGLAKALGVSTGTLYHYFSGKPDIFGQMLGHLAERDIAAVEAAIEPDDSVEKRLEALSVWLQSEAPRLRRVLLLSLDAWQLDPDADSRATLTRTSRLYRETLTDRLALPPELGTLLYSFVLGALVHETLDGEAGELAPQLALIRGLLGNLS